MASNLKLPKPGQTATIDPADLQDTTSIQGGDDGQKALRALIKRRHPEYEEMKCHWDFLEDTYEGGPEWFKEHTFRYIKEGDKEYADRVGRAYRFNHTREVVDLLNKYLFKQNIVRGKENAPESVQKFWTLATKNGLSINDLAQQISKRASIYGRIAIIVDNNAEGAVISKADEKRMNIRTYAYAVGPEQLLDYSYDDSGDLNWALIAESKRDDVDPMTSSGEERPRYRLWTKNDWKLYEEVREGRRMVVKLVGHRDHGLGVVPVVLHDNMISDELYCSPALIDDIAYLDRAVANYLSNLDAIIQDQTFSQLAMPAQNVLPGEDNYTKLVEMSTKRVFLYDGESNQAPFYLSPDPKQAQIILAVINKIINEIYHTVGLAGERTKQDNAMGIDNSSGVAKAYDFERVNALLAAKAASLEIMENKVAKLVAMWNGEDAKVQDRLVEYPDNFDTRGLYDEFDISARLMLVEAPDTVRRQQMEMLINKLFPQLAKDVKAKMLEELKGWPIDPVEQMAAMSEAKAAAGPGAGSDKKQTLQKTDDRALAKTTLSNN